LVNAIYNKVQKRVSILIDEYDDPILSVIKDIKKAEENSEILHTFFMVLKSLSDTGKTDVVFVTGVAKYDMSTSASVFNNCNDLTLHPKFAAICGFTPDEFRKYFTEYLPDVLEYNKSKGIFSPDVDLDRFVEAIFDYYDGYSWDYDTRVLNPFSLINFLDKKILDSYWFDSGTPRFLLELLKRRHSILSFPDSVLIDIFDLNIVDFNILKVGPLLFQTGYLTIDKFVGADEFLLKRPNKEVSEALDHYNLDCLLSQNSVTINLLKRNILDALETYDSDSLSKSFREILQWNSYAELRASEGQCHLLIHSVLKALSFSVMTQPSLSLDVFDMLLTLGKKAAFVFEFKFVKFSPDPKLSDEKNEIKKQNCINLIIRAAKDQIKIKNYDAKYHSEYQVVKRVAVGFVGMTDVRVEIY
jgi:hypothetical protein